MIDETKELIKQYLAIEWKIFPVHNVDGKGRCSCAKASCDNVGKHPRVPKGFKEGTDDVLTVADWISKWPDTNWGLSTGKPSNVIVLDVDEKDTVSGLDSLKTLESINGKLPSTLTQTTGGLGKHYFFKYPRNVEKVPSSVGVVAPGIDVRADGGYVILPPSNHRSGKKYSWNNFGTTIAECPSWLLSLMMKKSSSVTIDKIKEKASEIPSGRRNEALFYIACGYRGKHGLSEDEIFDKLMDHNLKHCKPPLEESEIRTISNSACHRYIPEGDKIVERLEDGRRHEIDYYDFDLTDKGNAFRFYVFNDEDMRYCYSKKRWFVYDGSRWEEICGGEADLRVYQLLRIMKQEAEDIENEEVKKRYSRFISKSSEHRNIKSTIMCACPLMEIRIESMNCDPLDFNCLNGTFNLKTQTLREHDPNDNITFLAQVEYDKKARCPRWMDHLDKIFDGDKKTIDSFQRMCGYSLTELNQEQVLFIIWGGGKNGKSTTFDVLADIFGDYASSAKAESFMKIGASNDARNDLARLYRKRLVVTSEPQRGSKLNESLVKSATGGDKISARFLYQEFFEWVPQFKIFINTNHQPKITESDEGIWRRIKMIPFTHMFNDDERDRNMKDKLLEEKAGILNWLIEGYAKYIDDDFGGFNESKAISQATSAYRQREDILQEYLDEQCVIARDQKILKSDLYNDFVMWCELSDEDSGTVQKFGSLIHGHLATKVNDIRINQKKAWSGIGLKEPTKSSPIDSLRSKAKQEKLR